MLILLIIVCDCVKKWRAVVIFKCDRIVCGAMPLLGIGSHAKQFIDTHRNNWIKWFPRIPITPYPQLSGCVFIWMQWLKIRLFPLRNEHFPNTDANQFATVGLTLSSVLFWNYVMHCKYKEGVYKCVCALDYLMIMTTTMTSTFPTLLKTKDDAVRTMLLCGLDQLGYMYRCGNIQTYNHHHYVCYMSTFIGFYRSYISKQWMPTVVRLYSTSICTLLFYTSISQLNTIHTYRQLPLYLPWVWHLHASLCQHTSIELAYHADATESTCGLTDFLNIKK